MMKANKDTLVKHRFWIVLGVAVCMTMVGMLFVSSDDTKKKVEEINQALNAKGGDVGPKTVSARQENVKTAKALETLIWEEAYKPQEPIYTWARGFEEVFPFRNGMFANAIKITALPADKKTWPADTPTLIHGKLFNLMPNYFEITDRNDKPVRIYLTQNILDIDPKNKNVKLEDKETKDIPWDDRIEKFKENKLFAVTYQTGKYFNDPLTYREQKVFADSYKTQIHDILRIVDPVDANGKGVVQLMNWSFDENSDPPDRSFIRYVSMPWNTEGWFSDEAWIAQENLWIQKEIYQIIKSANDRLSHFDGTGGEEKGKQYVFKNSYFELSLILNADSTLAFKIKNLLPKRQSIDLTFHVNMNPANPETEILQISAPPLAPAGDKSDFFVKTFAPQKDGLPRKGIYSVVQKLNWETAAVKRIDHISIGSIMPGDIAHSHRTFGQPLRPFELKAAPFGPFGPGPMGGPFGPGKAALPSPAPDLAGAPLGKGVFANGLRPNRDEAEFPVMFQIAPGMSGVPANRYVEVSDQSRRIPVGVVLIVDQTHVDRVLTAFNNSRMRFLETQVLLNLYPGSLQPIMGTRGPTGGAQADPVERGPKYSFTSFAAASQVPPGIQGPFAPPAAPRQVGGGSGSLESNMEMVIYGIVTLYQRFPPREKASGTDAMKK